MLHRFSKFLVACTTLLILAGSLVTSHDAGLSVPDWPTSYGWNMFTFPPSMWVANIRYEHVHRLVASSVGFLTIVLAVWLWLAEPHRRWLRWFGVAALVAVIAQGILGGLTVLYFLPPAVSTAHAGLAEIFFCMTVAIAVFTSPGWKASTDNADDRRLRVIATLSTSLIYAQIIVGAAMRHTGAGLAIPDFPWMFGHVVPDHWTAGIAVHFAHRVGAILVALSVVSTAVYIWRRHTERPELASPALLLIILVVVQIILGASNVLSRLQPWINSVHVVVGALVLTTSLVITLRTWRVRFDGAVRLKADTTYDGAATPVRLQADAPYDGAATPVRLQADAPYDGAATPVHLQADAPDDGATTPVRLKADATSDDRVSHLTRRRA